MYNDRYNRYGGYQGYRNYIGNVWTRHEVFETILREHPPKTEYTPGDYVVLMVRFNLDGGTYCYLSDDDIYDPGDLVTVKVRGEEKAVEVVSVGYYSPEDYPFENVHVRRVMGPAYGDLASKYEEAIREAKERETTRAVVSMEHALALEGPKLIVCGNAPTFLFPLLERANEVKDVAVIGVPVGFVNVVEAKERLWQSGLPCIAAMGRRGGSNVAAAIVNALLYGIEGVRP